MLNKLNNRSQEEVRSPDHFEIAGQLQPEQLKEFLASISGTLQSSEGNLSGLNLVQPASFVKGFAIRSISKSTRVELKSRIVTTNQSQRNKPFGVRHHSVIS